MDAAGLVLSVLPILFTAVDLSKDNIRRVLVAFRKRIYVGKLARALLLQKQTLAENLKSLASASGCDEVWLVDEDPLGYLKDDGVQEQILDFLGPENYAAFAGALEQSYETVKRIAGNIAGLLPGGKGPSDDLLEIIVANREAKGKLDLVPRIKLMFQVKDLKNAVEELDNTAAAVDRFTRVLLSNRQMVKGTPSRKAGKLAKALRLVRGFAGDLYLALYEGWREGCHGQHEANLFLEDRLSTEASILNRIQRTKSPSTPMLVFHLIFATSPVQGKYLSYEIPVQVYEGEPGLDRSEIRAVNRRATTSTQVTLVEPEPIGATPPNFSSVSNICGALESAQGKRQKASFVLTKGQSMRITLSDEMPLLPCAKANKKISFEELLSQAMNSRYNTPLKFRMLLALRLASNLLQLLQTQWLQNAWSKSAIYFPLRPEMRPRQDSVLSLVDLDRPFVSQTFDSKESAQPACVRTEPKVALLELGILLLEIWHQQTFEARFAPEAFPAGYYTRLAMAIEWLDDMADPMPEQYDKAVSLCVRGVIGGESHFADWEDTSFWAAICADIIEPLLKNCKLWHH